VTVPNTPAAPGRQVVVVGGSLVGLSMAIVLAHEGALVTVLERTPHRGYEGGGGLGIDVDLFPRRAPHHSETIRREDCSARPRQGLPRSSDRCRSIGSLRTPGPVGYTMLNTKMVGGTRV
jgi:flavin-dependent dehydrogenase